MGDVSPGAGLGGRAACAQGQGRGARPGGGPWRTVPAAFQGRNVAPTPLAPPTEGTYMPPLAGNGSIRGEKIGASALIFGIWFDMVAASIESSWTYEGSPSAARGRFWPVGL